MSCKNNAEKDGRALEAPTRVPVDAVSAEPPRQKTSLARIRQRLSTSGRAQLYKGQHHCSACGGLFSGTQCALCNGTGKVPWQDASLSPDEFVTAVVASAAKGEPGNYVWAVSHFDIREERVLTAVRQEVQKHPERALLGFAVKRLMALGLDDVVADADQQLPHLNLVSQREGDL